MSPEFEAIALDVQKKIDANSVWGKWGPVPLLDPSVPVYIVDPPGNIDDLSPRAKLTHFGRYAMWMGEGYGAGKLSPGFDFEKFKDLTAPGAVDALRAEIGRYTVTDGVPGVYWEDPQARPRDAADALGRVHDLLEQDADNEGAAYLLHAAEAYEHSAKTAQDADLLHAAYETAVAISEKGRAEANVWWLANSNGVIADNPYGVALKNVGDVVFGALADLYYVQDIQLPPVEEVVSTLGNVYGSRLGQLIAGDDPFSQALGGTLGGELGQTLAGLLTGKDSLDIGDSLLAFFDGDFPLESIFKDALGAFGIDTDDLSASALTKIADTLIAEAAEALGLEGVGAYVFTQAGESLAEYFTDLLSSGEVDDFAGLLGAVSDDIDFSHIGNYLLDLALHYVTNDFIGGLLEDARSLVEIDSAAEGYIAELGSIIGSVVGALNLPFLGGELGSTIGYILGSLAFEVLDFVSFGLFGDLFGHEPEPFGYMYVGLDPATHRLEVIAQDWRADGAEHDQIVKIATGNQQLTDAYLTYVNGIIDSIGGTVDGSFFYPLSGITLGVPALDPNAPILDHAMIGFSSDHFFLRVYWGGNEKTIGSNDPQTIIANAAAYELAHLVFYGGDLAQIRALDAWESSLNDSLVASGAVPPELLSVYPSTGNLPLPPPDPGLAELGANLQVAKDYRFYLDNSETINYLMAQAPQSSFTLGWIATLARAAELGLNAAYVGSSDGGAGTAADETILSADGNDLLFGNGGDDLIKAYGGDDNVFGGDGNDEIHGGGGRDTLAGDDGNDLIDGGSDDDRLFGGEGDDRLLGGRGADLLLGDQGADRLEGGDGDDRLFGYQGNDTLLGGAGDDEVAGEDGDDRLEGGAGDDILFGDGPGATGHDVILGGEGKDLARGGAGEDQIFGEAGDDRLYGDDGADEIQGGDGADRIEGGSGNDRIDGGAGNDRILGDAGDDDVTGGAGDDILYGLAGTDVLDGADGSDRLFGDEGDDSLTGGDGDDEAGGWTGNDRIEGGAGSDRLAGQDGDDIVSGGEGNDILYGDRAPDSGPLAHSEAEIIAAARARLGAGDFTILYQGPGYTYEGLRDADHDLIVINPGKSSDTATPNSERLWSAAEVDGIEAAGKTLVGYLNLAKINDFSAYWNSAWTIDGKADGALAANAPGFLAAEDNGFDHTRLVNFWEPGWRDLLAARIATIVNQGFSGLFLDDVLEYFVRRGDTVAGIAQAAREMRDLVIDVAATARSLVEARSGSAAADAFLIIVNGAPFLIQDTTADGSAADAARAAAFYGAIDGFLAENYFSQGLDYAIDQAVAEYGGRGIALFSVDTDIVSEEQRIGIERAAVNAGFLPEVVADAAYGSGSARFVPGFGDSPAPGDDVLDGGPGDDLLDGGPGNDTASYASLLLAVSVDLRLTGPQATGGGGTDTLVGIENLVGGASGDYLIGDSGANSLDGGPGADTMRGGLGDDVYVVDDVADDVREAAGQGIDEIRTGLASFSIAAKPNFENLTGLGDVDQILVGNASANVIDGGAGADSMSGGAGNDIYYVDDAGDTVIENAGEGIDEVRTSLATYSLAGTQIENLAATSDSAHDFRGNTGNNVVAGGGGNDILRLFDGGDDTVRAGAGNDLIFFGAALGAADLVDGGTGTDTLILQGAYVGGLTITANVTNIENLSILAGTNTSVGASGTELYDYVITTNDANFAAGVQVRVNAGALLPGEDFTFNGSAETDASFVIYGGRGVDTLTGGLGNDIFFFAEKLQFAPGDTVNGGSGYDSVYFRGNYTIDFNAPGYAGQFNSIESITLTSASDTRYARGGPSDFDYNIKLADANLAAGVTLTVNGTLLQSFETMVVDGSLETDGFLRIFAGASDDILKGGGQADLIHGNLGADTITGGGGADTFRYQKSAESTAASMDHILDFTPGTDKIELTRMDADINAAGDQAFHWIGSNAFGGTGASSAGELRAYQSNGTWFVEGDTNGDGNADLVIALTVQGATPLGQNDFFL